MTSEPKSKEEYQYNKDGSPLRTYTYKYNKDGSYTKYGINHNTGKETIRKYNTKNELTSYEVNSARIENGEEVKRTYKYKYNSDGSYTKYGINHNTGKETTWEYNANKQLTGKVIKEGDNEKVLSNFKYYTDENGKEYKDYTVEYNYTNGVHTKSYITERKLEKSDDNYIISSRNYQIIPKADGTFEERLIFTLNTDNVTDAKGKVHEGTYRTFYFYDENGNKIKEEFTTFYNKEEIEGKPIGTNSRFVKENKTITTFDPATGLKTSVITYSDKGITTTTFDKDGKTVKDTKTESFKENSYNNHNLKDVTGEDIIAEAEKYIGLNRRDGSYSIFGTNGSACATFATYILYQLGFDLTSITSRTTPSIRNQAEREGRYTSAADIFERVKNGEPIENIIKAGNIYTEVRESGSHTTIIKSAAYDSEKNEIILEVIGYESNAYTGVKTGKYVITQNENGEITRNNVVNKDIGFSDFVSTPEEIEERNKKLGLYQ